MKKEFNAEGVCYPEDHYMMDVSTKFKDILALIKRGKYFTINRPRQYGKSTMLHLLALHLQQSDTYLPIALNFQGMDEKWLQSDTKFAQMVMLEVIKTFKYTDKERYQLLSKLGKEIKDMNELSDVITQFVHQNKKKLVLLIDEVDASSEYASFLNFLGMLRTKYLARKVPRHATFHSVILAGVYDVKSLKHKLRNPEEAKYNSPWNIAIDFEIEMAFQPNEIAVMLEEYSKAEGVKIDVPVIAKRLYYHTAGYPFLVSKLCRITAEKVIKDRTTWTLDDIEQSVQLLLKENNTNFDSLINNLENNEELYNLVYQVLIEGVVIPFNPDDKLIHLGRMYGIFKENGRLKIHNRIYEQRLYNYMATKTLRTYLKAGNRSFGDTAYINKDNTLDLENVLKNFQIFMKKERSKKDKDFIEREWRLIFLSFLHPIVNGKGYAFKEVEISEEKRLDIVITYFQLKYIIELKLWRGPKKHREGLDQLADYLEVHSIKNGYLIIFDTRKNKTWEMKPILHKGKVIFAVWV